MTKPLLATVTAICSPQQRPLAASALTLLLLHHAGIAEQAETLTAALKGSPALQIAATTMALAYSLVMGMVLANLLVGIVVNSLEKVSQAAIKSLGASSVPEAAPVFAAFLIWSGLQVLSSYQPHRAEVCASGALQPAVACTVPNPSRALALPDLAAAPTSLCCCLRLIHPLAITYPHIPSLLQATEDADTKMLLSQARIIDELEATMPRWAAARGVLWGMGVEAQGARHARVQGLASLA